MSENKQKGISSIIMTAIIISFFVGGASGAVFGSLTYFLSGSDVAKQIQAELNKQSASTDQTLVVEEDSATIEVVEKVSPSVVSIVVTKDLSQLYDLTGPDIFPFDDFFDSPFGYTLPESEGGKQEVGGGTGFIISDDGLILTNKHVVSDTEAEYSVITNEGKRYDAQVVSCDPFNDIAVVQIQPEEGDKLPPVVELGDSDAVKIGQTVIAIGNTLGEYQNTVTKGLVSGIGRSIVASGTAGSEALDNVIQTDAAINPGNSGGPLLNLVGQVIGINTAIDQQGEAIGFAIPINQAKQAIDSVKEHGKIVRPILGVRYVMINQAIQKKNDLVYNYGALIVRGSDPAELAVIPGSAADRAGLVENDIILEMGGQQLDQNNTLAEQIQNYSPGDKVTLKIYHDGEKKEVAAELGEYQND